jgi:hypothetical protein
VVDRIDSFFEKSSFRKHVEERKTSSSKATEQIVFKKRGSNYSGSGGGGGGGGVGGSGVGIDGRQESLSSAQCLRRSCAALPSIICDAAGPLIDIIIRDFIDMWYANISDDRSFPNSVQDALVYVIGHLLMAAKQSFNPIEFALHKGSLLLRRHVRFVRSIFSIFLPLLLLILLLLLLLLLLL